MTFFPRKNGLDMLIFDYLHYTLNDAIKEMVKCAITPIRNNSNGKFIKWDNHNCVDLIIIVRWRNLKYLPS